MLCQITLSLSPEDPLLELDLELSSTKLDFQRQLLRISNKATVQFSAEISAHAGCWRPGLKLFAQTYSSFFDPWVAHAADFEGLGSYSWNQDAYNVTYAKSVSLHNLRNLLTCSKGGIHDQLGPFWDGKSNTVFVYTHLP